MFAGDQLENAVDITAEFAPVIAQCGRFGLFTVVDAWPFAVLTVAATVLDRRAGGVVLVLALLQRRGLRVPRWFLLVPTRIGATSLSLYGVALTVFGTPTVIGIATLEQPTPWQARPLVGRRRWVSWSPWGRTDAGGSCASPRSRRSNTRVPRDRTWRPSTVIRSRPRPRRGRRRCARSGRECRT